MKRLAAVLVVVAACGRPISNPFFDHQGACRAAGGACKLGPSCEGTVVASVDCNPNVTPGGSVCCKPCPAGQVVSAGGCVQKGTGGAACREAGGECRAGPDCGAGFFVGSTNCGLSPGGAVCCLPIQTGWDANYPLWDAGPGIDCATSCANRECGSNPFGTTCLGLCTSGRAPTPAACLAVHDEMLLCLRDHPPPCDGSYGDGACALVKCAVAACATVDGGPYSCAGTVCRTPISVHFCH